MKYIKYILSITVDFFIQKSDGYFLYTVLFDAYERTSTVLDIYCIRYNPNEFLNSLGVELSDLLKQSLKYA